MALTAEGKALTEANRRRQLAIAARAEIVIRALWDRLDVDDLDASTRSWLKVNTAAVGRFYGDSRSTTGMYLSQYRVAELGADTGPVVAPGLDVPTAQEMLRVAGPLRVKALIRTGLAPDVAHGAALTKFAGIARKLALEGGRELIAHTGDADPKAVGWRRVTHGNPCAFCAMLAARGPVYSSSARANSIAGSGLRYHGHCSCTAEVVYGEWKPSEREQEFIDSYNRAAAEASEVEGRRVAPKPGAGEDTILWRMRRDGLFSDSLLNRRK